MYIKPFNRKFEVLWGHKKGKIIQNRHYLRICFAQKKPIYKFLAIFWHVIFLDFFTLGDDP